MTLSIPIVEWNPSLPAAFLARPAVNTNEGVSARVAEIVERVRREGDAALFAYSQQFDGQTLETLQVSAAQLDRLAQRVPDTTLRALETAKANIEKFHRAQKLSSSEVEIAPGIRCWQEPRALQNVGLYVPGGTAPLPSTALMLAVPAAVAGCPNVVACSPPQADGEIAPVIAAALRLCGVKHVFRVGGAQAIAAMAFGTDSIPRVDKLFGPGNAYVTAAKLQVALEPGGPAFDMPAGPSEVMVLADDGARPEFVAADLLAQAEHGPDSQVIAVVTTPALAKSVQAAVSRQLDLLPRRDIATQALRNASIVLVPSTEAAIELANQYAAEHLILQLRDGAQRCQQITHAGSVFVGDYTPEAVGDYASGTNHVLPTYGNARAYSGLGVAAFTKMITFQQLTQQGLHNLGPTVVNLAGSENLEGHARSVTVRLEHNS